MELSAAFLDHLLNPRNRGQMEAPDGVGEVTGPGCGDTMTICVRVAQGRIADIRFKTSGCWAAQAAASMVTERTKGMAVGAAGDLSLADVAPDLDGLPEEKRACADLALTALRGAIRDHEARRAGKVRP